MATTDLLFYTSFAIYPLLFIAERIWPAQALRGDWRWSLVGLLFFMGYGAIGMFLPLWLPASWYEASLLPGADLDVATGALLGFLSLTFVNYLWHRAVHRVPLLWRVFHQVHHSAPRLDVSGSALFHPSEMAAYTLLSLAVNVFVLGLAPQAAAVVGLMLAFNAAFQHSNLRTPRWLGYLVQRPEAHSIHHRRGLHAFNYSDFPLWDLLFDTFRSGRGFQAEVGFDAAERQRWLAMALMRDVHEPAFRIDAATSAVKP